MAEAATLIMVVDDDFDALEIIRHILEARGYRTRCFLDPMEALQQMAAEKPRLVVTDLMMKALDTGFSFSRQIKFDPRYREIPIILITAALSKRGLDLQPRTPKDLERMGIDAFFDKPVAAGELVAKVEELLHRRGKEPER